MIIEITQENQDEILLKSEKPVLLFFHTNLDANCIRSFRLLEEILVVYNEKVIFALLNLDIFNEINKELIKKFEIRLLPTVIVLSKGNIIDKKITIDKSTFTEILNKFI
jgi:thioredoxin 1